jgi:hypothetical protein
MAIVTNTEQTYQLKRARETFADIISMLSPEDTPFQSMIGTKSINGVHPEWSTDALATPNPANAVVEGDTYTFGAVSPTNRVGNYTQILRKEWSISETAEKVDKAGQRSELARQRMKKGKELKKDLEVVLLSNQASSAGNTTTPRLLGGLPTWITSNDNRGTGGADGGFSAGTGYTVAKTDATTKRAFTKAIMDNIFQLQYGNGGKGNVLMLSPYLKTVFSSFMSDPSVAPQRMSTRDNRQATIVGAADTYLGDFGTYDIVPNRCMSTTAAIASNAYVLDPDLLQVGVLRPTNEVTAARISDATQKVLITEVTLIVENEAGIASAADLFGINATT